MKYMEPDMNILIVKLADVITTSSEIDNITTPENPDIGYQ